MSIKIFLNERNDNNSVTPYVKGVSFAKRLSQVARECRDVTVSKQSKVRVTGAMFASDSHNVRSTSPAKEKREESTLYRRLLWKSSYPLVHK